MYVESLKKRERERVLIDTKNRLVASRGWGWGGDHLHFILSEGGQNVQTSSYKIKKPWECNVNHGDYSW